MIVAAFDISKSATGYAVTDGKWWESGTWVCPVKRPFGLKTGSIDAGYAGNVGVWLWREMYAFLGHHRPNYAAIEAPMPGNTTKQRTVVDTSSSWAGQAFKKETVGGTTFDTTHSLHGLAFLGSTACAILGVPCVYIPVNSWRASVGVGKPPSHDKITHEPIDTYAKRRAWLKQEAKRNCGHREIPVTGTDQAEACLIAVHLMAVRNPRLAGHADDLFRAKSKSTP